MRIDCHVHTRMGDGLPHKAVLTSSIIREIDELAETRKQEIRSTADNIKIKGTAYYVAANGNDDNDGKTPDTAWQTTGRVSSAELHPGDGVFFRRGDIFRGGMFAKSGVTYAAYGEGEKPRIYSGPRDMAAPECWSLVDAEHNIWQYYEPISDCGTLVFDGGREHSRKLIPSYIGGRFVCRDDESRPFVLADEMTRDLDIFSRCDAILTTAPSKGESFPVPDISDDNKGALYLRCDRGNPGEVFSSIEAITWCTIFRALENDNVTVDNICMKYAKFGVTAGNSGFVRGLKVTNCEIGWIGGNVQNYFGTDPNYPEGPRGSVTRYGNGVEIYGGLDGYEVSNCYIYQCYDAGITHQVSTFGKKYEQKNILYRDNLVEDCVYSIEYFLEKNEGDTESYIENCEICHNVLRRSGYGWGQQRHNVHTPAHIKGWSYENTARNFIVHNNVFDRAAYRMVHLVAKEKASCPKMYNNTYIQECGLMLGQYGENRDAEPPVLTFDETAPETVRDVLHDENATVVII